MTADESINLAKDAIGEGAKTDYVISPANHAEKFKEKASDLAAILSSSAVITTAREYENEDQDALTAQKEFKRIFNRSNLAVLATGVCVALFMAAAVVDNAQPGWDGKWLLIALSLGGAVCGAFASKDLVTIRQGGLLEAWMSKRASAETVRLDYFERVAKSSVSSTAATGVPVELLKLEYFRRFQLDVQLAFYRERSKDHRREAKKTLSYSGWAVFGAAIATGAAGMLVAAELSSFAAIAALGAVFTGLSSFASMREAVNQDRRNAERYDRTYRVLSDLNKRLDDVRKAVCSGEKQPLDDFVNAVHEQLSLEHRQWLGEQGEARGAFAKLENTLKEFSSKITPTPGGASSS